MYSDGQFSLSVGVASTNSASEIAGTSGLDPYDITALNGNVYFTGADSHGRGLFEYDPATSKLTELIASTKLNFGDNFDPGWGAGSPITMAASGGELYFSASNPNATGAASVDQLYAYSGSGAAPTHFITGGSLNSSPNPLVFV